MDACTRISREEDRGIVGDLPGAPSRLLQCSGKFFQVFRTIYHIVEGVNEDVALEGCCSEASFFTSSSPATAVKVNVLALSESGEWMGGVESKDSISLLVIAVVVSESVYDPGARTGKG